VARVPTTPVFVADVPVTAELAGRVPVTPVPVALVPAAVVLPAVVLAAAVVLAGADPAARVAPTGEPETVELAAAAVVGAPLTPAPVAAVGDVAACGVFVALLPPQAARIAPPATLPAKARNRLRLSATEFAVPAAVVIVATFGSNFTHHSFCLSQ
jgi:hypothetical protein